MSMRFFAAAIAFVALAGCASTAPPLFQAAWFLASVEPAATDADVKGDAAPAKTDGTAKFFGDRLYIGVLNQSDEHHTASAIIINASSEASGPGWRLNGNFELAPGQMLIRPAVSFEKNGERFPASCHLPVSVVVVLAPDQRRTRAEIRGRMPNFLPADWDRVCAR